MASWSRRDDMTECLMGRAPKPRLLDPYSVRVGSKLDRVNGLATYKPDRMISGFDSPEKVSM